MKYIFLLIAFVVLAGGIYAIFINNRSDEQIKLIDRDIQTDAVMSPAEFNWSTTRLSQGSTGGSDSIPESDLQLTAFGKTYHVNEYLNEKIYGCRDDISDEYRDSTLVQYDSSYSPAFLMNAASYYLCPTMAGGDLFVIDKLNDGYGMKHYHFSDLDEIPFTKTTPDILFTINE